MQAQRSRRNAAIGVTIALAFAARVPAATRDGGNGKGGPIRVTVAFDDASACDVTIAGGSPVRQASPEADGGDFVCGLTGIAPRRAVDLAVMLPRGTAPTFADFPRLDWHESDGRWIGTVSLPSAPAFVRAGGPSGALARRARWLDTAALTGTFAAILWTLVYSARRADAGEIS